jgi:hypothetical protein
MGIPSPLKGRFVLPRASGRPGLRSENYILYFYLHVPQISHTLPPVKARTIRATVLLWNGRQTARPCFRMTHSLMRSP